MPEKKMIKRVIDLNCDMGESFGVYKLGRDDEIIKYISSANIACGFHAGDPVVMKKTIVLAKNNRVEIGAHPGFCDLVGFGRRPMTIEPERLKQELIYQLGALQGIAWSQGMSIRHVKLHGALYNLAAKDERLSQIIMEAILEYEKNLIFIALAGSKMYQVAKEMGLTVAREAFIDRAYYSDGNLVPRGVKGSVLENPKEITNRMLRIIEENKIETIDGNIIELQADTICIHGDNKAVVDIVREIHKVLDTIGVEIKPLGSFIRRE